MKSRIILIAAIVVVILIFSFQTVFAGSWTYHYSAAKVLGNSLGASGKKVSNLSNSQWLAEITSFTSPATVAAVGWTYWTSRELCNSVITQQTIHAARSVSSTSTYDYQYGSKLYCNNTHTGQVLGRNEVKGNLSIYSDEWTKSDSIQ